MCKWVNKKSKNQSVGKNSGNLLKPETYLALKWITGLLNDLKIPYQIVGGLAAKCYGSGRPLRDIDLYVPAEAVSILKQEVNDYIESGPEHYKDENWDLIFMKLRYNNQQIEIGDADNTRYFNSRSGEWIKEEINFSESTRMEYNGIMLSLMPKQKLIDYKKRLNRKVDRMDIRQMQR